MGNGPNSELLGFRIDLLPRQAAKLRHYHDDARASIPNAKDDALRKGIGKFLQLLLLNMRFVFNDSNELQCLKRDLQGREYEGHAPGWGAVVPLSVSCALLSTLLNGFSLDLGFSVTRS